MSALPVQSDAPAPAPQLAGFAPTDLAELVAAFNQVTEQLQSTHATLTEEVRRLRGELEHANERLARSRRLAALGEMAAGIAHEVRNPLGSIALYARMLEEDLVQLPEQKQTATKIASAVRGLDAIVGDVLTLARDTRLCVNPVLLSDLTDRLEHETCAELPDEVTLVTALPSSTAEIACDPQLIHQALMNLVRNAAEAVRVAGLQDATLGGSIQIVIERDTLGDDAEFARPAWAISIIDTGDGIPADALDRMFNPFYTTRDTGTGLGLSIVHRIADAHGGAVEAWNNQDRTEGARGATVRLVLPVEGPGEPGESNSTHESKAGRI